MNLQVLVSDDGGTEQKGGTTAYSTLDDPTDSDSFFPRSSDSAAQGINGNGQDYTYGRNANYTPRGGNGQNNGTNGHNGANGYSNGFNHHSQNDDYGSSPDGADDIYDGSPNNDSQPRSQRQQFDKFAKRTILLSNLPDGTTHAEITEVVRGGMLLDIYLRANDRNASVSFLEESAAQEFFRYVKRHDLYIRGKRVCLFTSVPQCYKLTLVRPKSVGTSANLFSLVMLQTKSPSAQLETLSSRTATQSILRRLFEKILSIFTTSL